MAVAKTEWTRTPQSYVFDTVAWESLAVASVGAGVANTTIQAALNPPTMYKIAKVSVYCSAIDAVTGDSFNLVVGTTASYTSAAASGGNPDNSFAQQLQGAPAGSQFGVGYPTNVATVGTTVFGADVVLNTTNIPNLAISTGGYAVLVPGYTTGLGGSYDAVYPSGVPLTLRMTTNASTGSVTNFKVTMVIIPITPRPFWQIPGLTPPDTLCIPGLDW
jgi:hypothetical protein